LQKKGLVVWCLRWKPVSFVTLIFEDVEKISACVVVIKKIKRIKSLRTRIPRTVG